MFNKPKTNPSPQAKTNADVPIPPLPDLPSPGGRAAAQPLAATPAPQAASAPAPARGASILARDLVFEGNISGSGELTVDGQIKGDVRAGRLIIGDTGSVEGSIQADTVEVRGRVVGAVTGQQVRLLGTAYVDGDINHEQLAIEVGAYFQGRCHQTRPGQAAPTAAPAPAPAPAPSPIVEAPAAPAASAIADVPATPARSEPQGEVVSLKPNP